MLWMWMGRSPQFVVCEVRKPLLSLTMMEDKGVYMTVEGSCRILGGHGRAICLRRQGNSNHVDMEFRDGLLERKRKGERDQSSSWAQSPR